MFLLGWTDDPTGRESGLRPARPLASARRLICDGLCLGFADLSRAVSDLIESETALVSLAVAFSNRRSAAHFA
jgi:hypothetical protein